MNLPDAWTLGIVGHGADKFTRDTELQAKRAMLYFASETKPSAICSGASPLGGVDAWAEALAGHLGLPFVEHAPKSNEWAAPGGFRDRNLAIARDSAIVLCVVAAELPGKYDGRRFSLCYHCARHSHPPPRHVKSGGCWTAWKAPRGFWAVVSADRYRIFDAETAKAERRAR